MKMNRFIIRFSCAMACVFGLCIPAIAQIPSGFVQVSATVPALANGSYGAAWTNQSSSPNLPLLGGVSTFQTTINGRIDSNGSFTTLVADNDQILPTPSTWTWTFTFECPTTQTVNGGFMVAIPITGGGGTQDISAAISAAVPTNPCGTGATPLSIETNGVLNTSQVLLNFVNPSSFNGLSFTFSNPSGGIESFGVTGTLNNAGLTNASITVNGTTCTLGSSCTVTSGPTFQTNSVNNTTQTALNFVDTATVKFTNPGTSTESATVPTGTNAALGVTQCDGTTTLCTAGAVSVPTGTTSALGILKGDGTTTTITAGAINVVGVNGAGLPTSAKVAGTNASKQIVAASASDVLGLLSGSRPWQGSFTFAGVPVNSQILYFVPTAVALTIPSGCAGSYAGAQIAATASADILVQTMANPTATPTTICTIHFGAGGTVASFSGTGASLTAGEYLLIIGPASADATLADLGGGIYGTY